jgi:hypothetical protein
MLPGMSIYRICLWASAGVCLAAGVARAQNQESAGLRGHWTGTIAMPGQSLSFELDLDTAPPLGWVGSVSIPLMGASGIPLDPITVENGRVMMHIKGGAGDPTMSGTLSSDGQTLAGSLKQGTNLAPFTLKRSGDPKVEAQKSSPPVRKDFLGTWEGKLDVGQTLRMVLKISNSITGAAAVLTSQDQANAQMPVGAIEQKESKLTLRVNVIGGLYTGEINKEGTQLSGTWTQQGMTFPLVFTKTAN